MSSHDRLVRIGGLLDLDALPGDFDRGVLINFKDLVLSDLLCDPVCLCSVLQSYDLLTQVQSCLNVEILVVLGHPCVVHDQFDAFVRVVGVTMDRRFWHFQLRHLVYWRRSYVLF